MFYFPHLHPLINIHSTVTPSVDRLIDWIRALMTDDLSSPGRNSQDSTVFQAFNNELHTQALNPGCSRVCIFEMRKWRSLAYLKTISYAGGCEEVCVIIITWRLINLNEKEDTTWLPRLDQDIAALTSPSKCSETRSLAMRKPNCLEASGTGREACARHCDCPIPSSPSPFTCLPADQDVSSHPPACLPPYFLTWWS